VRVSGSDLVRIPPKGWRRHAILEAGTSRPSRELSMQVSDGAKVLLEEIRRLRAERQRRLQCDLHLIDVEHDRHLRQLQTGAAPICLRRRCRRSVRRLRQALTRRGN
jgi:hypothetical protein